MARIKLQKATQILRAGTILSNPRDAPRNGGPGGGRIWARSTHPEPTPWCFFGFFLGIQKEARRPQAAKSPAERSRNKMVIVYQSKTGFTKQYAEMLG